MCVLDADKKEYDLRPFMEVLIDPKEEFSIKEMATPEIASQFASPQKGHFNFGFTKGALWFRFTIQENKKDTGSYNKNQWIFDPGWNTYDTFYLFVPDPRNTEKWIQYSCGRLLAPSWSMDKRHFSLPTEINYPTTCYIRATGFRPLVFSPHIATLERTIWINSLKVFGLALLIGFFLTMAMAQFAILVYTKSTKYKWFFIGNITFIGYTASSSYQYIINFQNLPTVIMSAGMIAQGVMLSVVRSFLETRKISKILDIIVFTSIIATFAIAIYIFFINEKISADLVMNSAAATTSIGALASICSYKRNKTVALIFIAAWIGITTAVSVFDYAAHGRMEFCHPSIVWYGFVFEAICHSILLAYSVKVVSLERQKAEANANAKANFLANMSHEIRTPMTAVVGFLQLAIQLKPTGQLNQYLMKIQTAANHLMGVINDILDVSKIEAGKIELESRPFNIETLLQNTADILVTRAFENTNELVISVDPDIPRTLIGDPLRLQQILVNLGGNAVKFTHNGTVLLAVNQANLPASQGTASLRFWVSDTGIGIDPASLSQLFQPFSQADKSTTRVYGGTGLGLSISRRLAELMGGELTATSNPGDGSTFEFTISLHIEPSSDNELPRQNKTYSALQILIIEDNRASREAMKAIMNELGLTHKSTETIKEAFDLLSDDSFDLIILDWDLPDMPGPEAVTSLRALPLNVSPLIAFMTSMARLEAESLQPERFGVDALLAKPFTLSSVENLLRKLFNAEIATTESQFASLDSEKPDISLIKSLRILLAEDNQFNQELIRALLEESRAKLEIVNNGKEAVNRVLDGHKPRIDIILMDLHMPIMDGYEATIAIRTIFKKLPIVAMTADVTDEDKEQCFKVGMNGHLTKPIDIAALYYTLAKIAAGQRS